MQPQAVPDVRQPLPKWPTPLRLLFLFTSIALAGCTTLNSHTNSMLTKASGAKTKATLNIDADRGRDDIMVILAFSGGGSRSAYFSASVMLKLAEVMKGTDMLAEVDAISSVSGGSLPAAYYAISTDPDEPSVHGRVWDEETVKSLMGKNFLMRWIGNWFRPNNAVRFWFTGFDRTDIMAKTLADNLFDTQPLGRDLKIRDLRDERPYLVLNATNGSKEDQDFGRLFTFTSEEFQKLNSDINEYHLSRAVMATAAFPGAFNYMTLKNYEQSESTDTQNQFVHVFDGGSVDNVGLNSVSEIVNNVIDRGTELEGVIVILVDAHTGTSGVSKSLPDTRRFYDFIVDTNFIDATDSLLSVNRTKTINTFKRRFPLQIRRGGFERSKSMFYHISFDDIADLEVREAVQNISTSFSINPSQRTSIDEAVDEIMTPRNNCLIAMAQIIKGGRHALGPPVCNYEN